MGSGNGHARIPAEIAEFQFPPIEIYVPPRPRRRPIALPLLLFLLTVISTLAVGAEFARSYANGVEPFSTDDNPFVTMMQPILHPGMLKLGIPFSFTLLTILAITSPAASTELKRRTLISFPLRRCSARSARSFESGLGFPLDARFLTLACPVQLWALSLLSPRSFSQSSIPNSSRPKRGTRTRCILEIRRSFSSWPRSFIRTKMCMRYC